MKVTGALIALAAAAPMAAAVPFPIADFLAPTGRAPAPAGAPVARDAPKFPQLDVRTSINGTITKRGINPNSTEEKTKRSFGVPVGNLTQKA
ncbi:hypothetical protein ACRE_080440 [Hapsidospora chrysogenum ATCC 11550]|uniref:Uncharacterized protein n=1 Tax=Hapsidospora chrysogenum (strain ATCC 11550 / CBS 779.69 / DSM 880 / IAM 14645 / JCM 23072 / IMI 49137) TaxID=857340 RepID=A0A086SVV8_HAPC1|nr:hypothetical protein ACRE_080440 [Hapsidospora chrysogenum ATCC 11550]